MAECSVTVRIDHSAPSSRFNEATAPTLDEAMAVLGYAPSIETTTVIASQRTMIKDLATASRYNADAASQAIAAREAHWATITQLTASLAEANRQLATIREYLDPDGIDSRSTLELVRAERAEASDWSAEANRQRQEGKARFASLRERIDALPRYDEDTEHGDSGDVWPIMEASFHGEWLSRAAVRALLEGT